MSNESGRWTAEEIANRSVDDFDPKEVFYSADKAVVKEDMVRLFNENNFVIIDNNVYDGEKLKLPTERIVSIRYIERKLSLSKSKEERK
mgnify:CR=1 FL=1